MLPVVHLIALLIVIAASARAAEPLTVFGAASLTDALQAVGAAQDRPVRFSFASSSTLARQIEAGAPADLFCAANEKWMDYLAERDLIEADTRTSPIGNALVLVAPAATKPGTVTVNAQLDLAGRIGTDDRLALGDPAHVPAGIYARQALTALGLWDSVSSRLAPADNVRSALALVGRGEAPLGIVYATDAAIDPDVAVIGTFPADSHPPITYPCAILKGRDSEAAGRFLDFLTGPEGLAIFTRFGFRPN